MANAGAERVPSGEIAGRIARFQDRLRLDAIAAALLTHASTLYYFSGTAQQGYLFIPADGAPILFIRRHIVRAREESSLARIVSVSGFPQVAAEIGRSSAEMTRLGIEADVLPTAQYFRIRDQFPGADLTDISIAAREIRMRKSPWEIERIRAAGQQLARMFSQVPRLLAEGQMEQELAALLEYELRAAGHQGFIRMRAAGSEVFFGNVLAGEGGCVRGKWDGPTCGAGPNPAVGVGAGTTRIERDKPVFIDLVGAFGGYVCDQTRVFVLGRLPLPLQEAHSVCMEIQNQIVAAARPGVRVSELFVLARDLARQLGFGPYFMGPDGDQAAFVGHGVGLDLDELPVVTERGRWRLTEGMVIAIEPKMVFPGQGAVGVENTWLITADGIERLTSGTDEVTCVG